MEKLIAKVLAFLALVASAFMYAANEKRKAKDEVKGDIKAKAAEQLIEEIKNVEEISNDVANVDDDELIERMQNRARKT